MNASPLIRLYLEILSNEILKKRPAQADRSLCIICQSDIYSSTAAWAALQSSIATASNIGELMSIRTSRMTLENFERLASETGYAICQRTLWLINPHYKQKFHINPRREWTFLPIFHIYATSILHQRSICFVKPETNNYSYSRPYYQPKYNFFIPITFIILDK